MLRRLCTDFMFLVNKQNNRMGKIRRNTESIKYLLENKSWAEIQVDG